MPTWYGQAIRLSSTINLSREDWLQIRMRGIGSSDAAVAVGLSPYKSALSLWLEKTGRRESEDISDKPAVFWGTRLEALIAEVYAEQTGFTVRRVNYVLQHPEHYFMLANLDRVVRTPEGESGILEIKTAGFYSTEQWEESIPIAYQCQVLHQLAVTGHDWADIAVLIAGQDFRIYRIQSDPEKISTLIEREQEFWQNVEDDIQPLPDGSEDAGQSLSWLYQRDNGLMVDLSESMEANALFSALLQERDKKALAEAEESRLKQQLQSLLGEASGASLASGAISWKQAKDSIKLDTQKLQEDYPELIKPYQLPVPGSRRFLVQKH